MSTLQVANIFFESTANNRFQYIGSNTVTVSTAGVERMRIDSSGNVGIGTSSPSFPLVISRVAVPTYLYQYDGSGAQVTGVNGSGLGISGTFSATAYGLFTDSTERARFAANGNFGIGTTSPSTKLHVVGTGTFDQTNHLNNPITAATNAATVPITSRISTITNNSAATLTVTMTTTNAIDGQMIIVRILDFSAVAQTITWVNTENSSVSVPTTTNGSTTSPLTVGFQYNSATSKWRCLVSA